MTLSTTHPAPLHRWWPAALARLLMLVVAVTVAMRPATAHAHGALKSSAPSAGAQLAVAPTQLRLTFTEVPELAVTRIQLLGPDGNEVPLAAASIATDSKRAVVAAIRGPLTAGGYTVVWQIAGADGHPVRSRFTFTIAPGSPGLAATAERVVGASGAGTAGEAGAAVTAPGQTPPPAAHHDPVSTAYGGGFDAESPLYVATRWLQYTGLLIVLGAVAFQYAVLGCMRRTRSADSALLADDARDRAARAGLWAAGVVGVAALLRLYAQSYALHGAEQALSGPFVSSMLTRTVWGWGWLLQAAGVVIAALGFRAARQSRAGWAVAALGAVALAVTPALSGHAASAPRLTALAVLADTVHVIGAGGWLGSLLLVVGVGIPLAMRLAESERGLAVADLVNAFSPTALVFAGLAAATGVFAAWIHVGTVPALWQTPYGRTLLLKLAVLSVVAATGAYNWRRVRPALGRPEGATRIQRSATVELVVGLVVLLVTAVLVATPTAADASAMGG